MLKFTAVPGRVPDANRSESELRNYLKKMLEQGEPRGCITSKNLFYYIPG